MKLVFIIFAALIISFNSYCQNCSAASSGFIPINDLGTGTFTTSWNALWQGGLYPNGSNFLPTTHKAAGMSKVSQVVPRDQNGNADSSNGKIVWLSIGMSNTTQETQKFIPLANAFPNKNPKVLLVDGAQGGQSAGIISSPWVSGYTNFWNTVNTRLTNAGATAQQVQVIWFKEADQATKYTNVHDYYDSLRVMITRIMNDIKIRFPNVQLCYMASRISARYATSALNPEPYSYYTGWAVKKVIENQINGDPKLQFTGSGAKAPWLSWGIYMWSDGSTPQLTDPNIFWTCPTDFVSDGTHPSQNGQQKVAGLLLNFFSTDSTCIPWFLKAGTITSIEEKDLDENKFTIYPNPAHSQIMLETSVDVVENLEYIFNIFDLTGRIVKSIKITDSRTQISITELPAGIYYYNLVDGKYVIKASKFIIK